MPRLVAVCAGLLCACTFPSAPTLLPPPFGPDIVHPEPARLFFPTGVVIACRTTPCTDPFSSWVVVSNSNADRLYDAGAMYSLSAADLKKYFQAGSPPCDVPVPPRCDVPFSTFPVVGAVITGNFTGPMILAGNPSTGVPPLTAYTASRDTNRLNSVALDPATGLLSCRGQAAAPPDCRAGSIDLNNTAGVEGPFGIAAGPIRLPGTSSDMNAVMVASMVPRIEDIQNGFILTSSHVAALDQNNPAALLFSAFITKRDTANNIAGGPMVFDDRSRQVIVSGCFSRFASASAGGELSTLKCPTTQGTNLLRLVPMDAGSDAIARIFDFGPQLHATDTTGLALGGVDAATGLRRLYMVTRFPDTFVRVAIPADPAFGPTIELVTTISSLPSQIFLLQRPSTSSGPDLLAVTAVATFETSTAAGKLLLIDGSRGAVVGQVDSIGDTPYFVAQFPPVANDTSARLVVTQFGSCGLTLIDVPYDNPGGSTLRARIGSCPQ